MGIFLKQSLITEDQSLVDSIGGEVRGEQNLKVDLLSTCLVFGQLNPELDLNEQPALSRLLTLHANKLCSVSRVSMRGKFDGERKRRWGLSVAVSRGSRRVGLVI